MTTDRELMQQALDALEEAGLMIGYKESGLKLQNALRARLAQPEQEPVPQGWAKDVWESVNRHQKQKPVAWWHDRGDVIDLNVSGHGIPLYTTPPQREWCQCKDAPNDCTYENNCRVPQIDAAFKRIEWQGLTDEEIREFEIWLDDEEEKHGWNPPADIVKHIEAKLKEKNYG